MKKLFFSTVLTAIMFSSFAQVKCNINKASAYFTVSIPGTQMVDEKGNPVPPIPNVVRFIYVEGKGISKPVIESVTYNAVVVKTTVSKVEDSTVIVGRISEDEQPITLRAKKGYSFWKLELEPVDDKPQDPKACKNIILKIKIAGKSCVYKIAGGESQLYTLPTY